MAATQTHAPTHFRLHTLLLPLALLLTAHLQHRHAAHAHPTPATAHHQTKTRLAKLSQIITTHQNTQKELPGSGYTLEPCRTKSDCRGDRVCFDFNPFDPALDDAQVCGIPFYTAVGCTKCKQCDNYPFEICVTALKKKTAFCGGRAAVIDGFTEPLNCPDDVLISPSPSMHAVLVAPPAQNMSDPESSLAPSPSATPPSVISIPDHTTDAADPDSMDISPTPLEPPSQSPEPTPSNTVPASVSASASASATPSTPPLPTPTLPTPTLTPPVVGTTTGPGPTPTASGETDSPAAEPQSTEAGAEDSEVCIALEHIRHLPASQLVYGTHRQAAVLCDPRRNCATPGHMVRYSGTAMMMTTYCRLVQGGCAKRIMRVNSPTFGRRRVIASNSHDLVFTVLAARYASTLEEAVLAIAVHHLGL